MLLAGVSKLEKVWRMNYYGMVVPDYPDRNVSLYLALLANSCGTRDVGERLTYYLFCLLLHFGGFT